MRREAIAHSSSAVQPIGGRVGGLGQAFRDNE